MDPRERMGDFQLALQAVQDGLQSRLWTAMPARVVSYNAAKQTVVLQPTIQAQVLQQDGTWKNTTLPVLEDVPVDFPSGGGFTLTFPLAEGDEGIVVFGKNCIDAWWQQGGIQPQAEVRQHNLSDGMFVPGLRSVPRVPAGQSTSAAQLRSDDGKCLVELAAGHVVNIVCDALNITVHGDAHVTADGNATIKATTTTVDGDLAVTGNATIAGTLAADGAITSKDEITRGLGTGDQVTLGHHLHTSGGAGSPTSAPTPGT